MKKITLSVGLLASIISAKAQDTLDFMITQSKVYQFEHKTMNCLYQDEHENDVVILWAKENQVIKFQLNDGKLRTRKVYITYPSGEVVSKILDSKMNIYATKVGPLKLEIGKSKFIQKL